MYSDEELSGVGSYFYDWGVDQPEGFTLMQYTGLKDANGVEIYEGDIVAFNDGSHTTVQWDNFYAKFTPFHDETFGCHSGEDVKVIGNIYANPNLIGERRLTP